MLPRAGLDDSEPTFSQDSDKGQSRGAKCQVIRRCRDGRTVQVHSDMKEHIVNIIAQSAEEMAAILRRGLSPLTNNRDALLALGFERAYPQVRKGHDSTIWERTIDLRRRPDGYRVLARERAYLIDGTGEK